MTLFCPRSPPFMSSNGIFLQAKWSKIKERVEGWESGKKMTSELINGGERGQKSVMGQSILL